jgi:hypothetical protein
MTMNKLARHAVSVGAALTCLLGASTAANAAFFATICDDLACTGGNDVTILDNSAGDTIAASGGISFATSAFGYSLLVNTSQSKPMIGSAAAPQLDLTYTATTNSATAASVFLYTSDTDFISGGSFVLGLGGTNSGGSGTETGRRGVARATRRFNSRARICSALWARCRVSPIQDPQQVRSPPPSTLTR